MCGMDQNIENFTIEIFAVDPAGLSQSPPVIQPMPNSFVEQTPHSVKRSPCAFPEITGRRCPTLMFMSSTIPLQMTVMCGQRS